jgi:serine/threonine-protein kinase
MMMIAEGTQFGPYRLLEKIGAGGMGEVYRALDTRLEREVALKLVSESYLATDAGSGSPSPAGTPRPHDTPRHGTPQSGGHLSHERFLREARSAATLNHPNVCAIHDTGEQDGRPYLVMELLRGETLKQYLARAGGRGLPAGEVISFSQQAAAALAAAHAIGRPLRRRRAAAGETQPELIRKTRSFWRTLSTVRAIRSSTPRSTRRCRSIWNSRR